MYWPKTYTDLPSEENQWLAQAEALLKSEDYNQVLWVSQAFLEQHSDSVLPHIIQARTFINTRRFAEAEVEINYALAKRNNNATIYALAGLIAISQENYREAIDYFQQASELAQSVEEKSKYLFWVGNSYSLLRDYKAAAKYFGGSFQLQSAFISGWAFLLANLAKSNLLLYLFVGIGVYSATMLPVPLAILPPLLFGAFTLLTTTFFLKTGRLQQAVVILLLTMGLLLFFYFRVV